MNMDMLGRTIDGKYRLERLITEGRNSLVYEAECLASPRRVAIKLLHPTLVDDPRRVERFRHEAEVLRRLRHRHSVTLMETGQPAGELPYHVLELLEGETLRRRLDRDGPLSVGEVTRLARQAAGVLQALHDLGVVHRDVRPGNLFLVSRPGSALEVKLLDPGEALNLDERQRVHEVVGSRGYMSPEQFRGEVHETTAASDLFALAIVVYEALCGRRPFEADDDDDLLYEVSSGRFTPVSSRVEGLPRRVDAVLSRALHRERDQRHRSIETFAVELGEILERRPEQRSGPRDTARMSAVPVPEQEPAPARDPTPTAPAEPPPARDPTPPAPASVIPGLPLVDPSAEPGPEPVPLPSNQAQEEGLLSDKTMVDAAPPVPVQQPQQTPAPVPPQEQAQVNPYVPAPGTPPRVPQGLAGPPPAPSPPHVPQGLAGPPPAATPTPARPGGSSTVIIVVGIAGGVVGLALLVALYLFLR